MVPSGVGKLCRGKVCIMSGEKMGSSMDIGSWVSGTDVWAGETVGGVIDCAEMGMFVAGTG